MEEEGAREGERGLWTREWGEGIGGDGTDGEEASEDGGHFVRGRNGKGWDLGRN